MAEPARRLDPQQMDPKSNAPVMPGPTGGSPELDPRFQSANQDARIDNRSVVERRSAGSGVIIAGIVVVLAVIAYFLFAPGANTPGPNEPATTSEPSTPPASPAPDATAPVAPATPAQPAPAAPQN